MEKNVLKTKGIGTDFFDMAARYAVWEIDKEEMYHAFAIMDRDRCPLYMVGNSTLDEMREYLNEWGVEHGLEEDWYAEFGDEEKALFRGYAMMCTTSRLTDCE